MRDELLSWETSDKCFIYIIPFTFRIGPDISTGIDLNSSIFDPFYNYATEIQEPAITPCATLLLKVCMTGGAILREGVPSAVPGQ